MKNKINSNVRFTRWQQILREHLTFLNNLILTFSIGVFGFIISLLNDKNFEPICCQKIFFSFGLFLIFTSIFTGLATSFSRLLDFKTTLKKINKELKNDNSEVELLKKKMEVYGNTTWILFYIQVGLFVLAIINLAIAFTMIYSNKLF